jgi:hypothetical protein
VIETPQSLPNSVIAEAWSEFLYPRSAVGDLRDPRPESGFTRAMRVVEQWVAKRDGQTSDVRLAIQNRHVRDLQAVIGHMGKVLHALRAGDPSPEPLTLPASSPQATTDLVADARAAVNRSMDLLADLRAQLEGIEFESPVGGSLFGEPEEETQ